MNETSNLNQNLLLRVASEGVRTRIAGHLTSVEMKAGDVLYESGELINDLYFPTSGIVTLLMVTMDGQSSEVALVGNEGVVGIELFLGGESTLSRSFVQSAGHAYKLKRTYLEAELNRDNEFYHLLLRYTQALITQIAQNAACNRQHSIEQHLCRWLLQSMDRVDGDELTMTQEMIANMLGVRREGVTVAAHRLQQAGLIEYRRGHIKIMNRHKIEELCCECYADIRREYDRLGMFA